MTPSELKAEYERATAVWLAAVQNRGGTMPPPGPETQAYMALSEAASKAFWAYVASLP